MTNFKEYADTLVKTHGKEKALEIAESCLVASSNNPNTFLYDEAAYYLGKDGSLELAKDQKKFVGNKDKRLKRTNNFWLQVTNIIKKLTKEGTNVTKN